MFNLEKSIIEWRRQMLDAGIKTPVPLNELESHLRDDVEQQMQSGLSEEDSFKSAAHKIGQPRLLRAEFRNAGGLPGWLGDNKYRVLGLLWLAYCAGGFFMLAASLLPSIFYTSNFGVNASFLLALLLEYIYLRGIVGSVLLFGGVMRERRFIRLIAILDAFGGIAEMITKPFSPLVCAFTVLGIVSIWLLRPPQQPKLAAE